MKVVDSIISGCCENRLRGARWEAGRPERRKLAGVVEWNPGGLDTQDGLVEGLCSILKGELMGFAECERKKENKTFKFRPKRLEPPRGRLRGAWEGGTGSGSQSGHARFDAGVTSKGRWQAGSWSWRVGFRARG